MANIFSETIVIKSSILSALYHNLTAVPAHKVSVEAEEEKMWKFWIEFFKLIFTFAKKVMFSVPLVCFFVCMQNKSKTSSLKFLQNLGSGKAFKFQQQVNISKLWIDLAQFFTESAYGDPLEMI